MVVVEITKFRALEALQRTLRHLEMLVFVFENGKKNNANVNPVVKIFVIVKTNIRKPCNFYVLDDLVHT